MCCYFLLLFFCQVAGTSTNIGFLERLIQHESFRAGDVHTGFIEQHSAKLFPEVTVASKSQQLLAALVVLCLEKSAKSKQSYTNGDV